MSKNNTLILAALVIGGAYFFSTKTAQATKPKTIPISPTNLDKKGYYFVNCDKIVIKDEQTAFKYVFNVTRLTDPIFWDGLIFEGCLGKTASSNQEELLKDNPNLNIKTELFISGSKDPIQQKFLYDLGRYSLAGLVNANKATEDNAQVLLNEIIKLSNEHGADTSNWDKTLPNKTTNPKLPPKIESKVLEINKSNFETEVEKSNLPVIIEFYAEWCPGCKVVAPILDKLSIEYFDKIKFVKIDHDENPELIEEFDVKVLPTFAKIVNGQLYSTAGGIQTETDIQKFIQE